MMLLLIGCVGDKKPTTNARCDEGFQFDPVSRSCFAAGSSPVGTLSQLNIFENSGKNFVTLTYRDGNNDLANSCQVINDSPSKIELSSPRVYDFDTRSQVLLTSIEGVYNLIAPAAMADRDNARVSVSSLRASTSLAVSQASRDSLIAAARNVAIAAMASAAPGAASSGSSLMGLIDSFEEYFSGLSNRCDCAAGVCQTVLVPRLDNIGAAGFRYSISEPKDGVSSFQNVAVSIDALADRPVATSGHFGDLAFDEFFESTTSTPLSYTFTPSTPLGVNVSTSYFFSDTPDRGVLSGCVPGLSFPGLCSYTPFSGNLSDQWDEFGNQRASAQEGTFASVNHFNIQYTSTFKGSMGNNTRIRYVAYQGLGHPPEGTVRVISDAIGPIIEVTIIPNQTLNSTLVPQLQSAFNNARLFVDVTPLFDTTSQVSEVNLNNGQDAQDTFRYQVCNGMLCSEGAYTLRIIEQDDPPTIDVANVFFTPNPVLEDGVFDIGVAYLDSDNSLNASACAIDSTDPGVIADYFSVPCSCVSGVCTATITTNAHLNGATSLPVRVTNNGLNSLFTDVNFAITPVNDPPLVLPDPFIFSPSSIDENNGTINPVNVYNSPSLSFSPGESSENGQTITMSIHITNFSGGAQDVIPMSSDFITVTNGATILNPTNEDPTTPYTVTIPAGVNATTFTLQADKFKSTLPGQPLEVNVILSDNGGTLNGGVDTNTYSFDLDVVNVNFPPTISSIAITEANEGGEVYSPVFFITEGGESNETSDIVQIQVLSSNPQLLPAQNITIHYNLLNTGLPHAIEALPLDSNVAQDLDTALIDAGDFPVILRMKPVGSETGTTNITIIADDQVNPPVSQTFPLIIHPISANHGGWNQIKAVSNKVFSASQLDPSRFCSETTSCGSDPLNPALCRGQTAPNSSVDATEIHSIFFDEANQRCHFSTDTGSIDWQELNTFCPVTKSDENTNCVGASCLGNTAPSINPTAVDQYFFDYLSRTCYRSEGLDVADWVPYFPSEVTIGWNDFELTGDGADLGVLISGWQVFRRRFEVPFDFSSPIATLPASARSYEDKTVNENTLYYYLVRPVDSKRSIATATNDVFSEIRVMTPPRNMAFVHRWMANQEVCEKMGKSLENEMVDPEKNFRCEFRGPGAVEDLSNNKYYYDLGRDLFVDIAEAGCPFTRAPVCTSNGCIGVGEADPAWATTAGRIYYNRSNGSCYRSNGASWIEIETATIDSLLADATQSVLLPPLVNVTQARSQAICSNRSDIVAPDLAANLVFDLPSRKDQIAYSAQPLNLSDNAVEQIERGLSLNSSSKCNGSSANGVSGGYTSGPIPPSSFYYSIPGTSASGIRSVATGSIVMGNFQSTQACSSRYGAQDVYGNVAEWVTETMTCTAGVCLGDIPSNFDITNMSVSRPLLMQYGFDGEIGPCRDVDADGTCDTSLTSWLIQDKSFNANFFSFPMGLPIHRDFVFDFPLDPISVSSLEIGPTSGITNAQLKRDSFIINSDVIEAPSMPASNRGGFAVGGGYLSADAAGRYTFELVPDAVVTGQKASGGQLDADAPVGEFITFLAAQEGSAGNSISVVIVQRTSAVGGVEISTSGSSIVISVPAGGATGADIEAAIEDPMSSSFFLVDQATTTDPAAIFTGSGSGNFLSGGVDPVNPRRVDIGFRCIAPLDYATNYQADPEFNY